MKKLFIALAGLLIISANSQAQEVDMSTSLSGKSSVRKSKKVYIGAFDVSQYVQTSGSATAGGGGAFAKMTVNFGGIDGDAYQKMVGEVYDEAIKKFVSLGYEIVPEEEAKTKVPDGATFAEVGKPEKMNSGTATGVIIRPKEKTFSPSTSITAWLHYAKVAKSVDANAFFINLQVSTVDFGRGNRFSRTAKVSADAGLSVTGFIGLSSADGKGGGAFTFKPVRGTNDDWVGSKGLYETSNTDLPWMGSSRGKYTLDINQEKYLGQLKTLLTAIVMKSIDQYHEQMNK